MNHKSSSNPAHVAILIACGLMGFSSARADTPPTPLPMQPIYQGSHVLTQGDLSVELMDPNDPHRYNTGVRFTPIAAIIRASLGPNEFLMHEPKHDPKGDVAGLFSEFDIEYPPGFDEIEISETHLKIGVGVLTKDTDNYQFYKPHELYQPAITDVTWGISTAKFHQTCAPYNGYGYDLNATVDLSNNSIVINWQLKNIGSKRFETQQYTHNCFRFNHLPIDQNYAVTFPYDVSVRGLTPHQQLDGRSIKLLSLTRSPVNMFVDYPAFFTGENTFLLTHAATGLFVKGTTSLKGNYTQLHVAGRGETHETTGDQNRNMCRIG